MSKVLSASCVGGIVTSEGFPVPAATVQSEGVGTSTGLLILDEDNAHYIAKISPDLKSTLDKISTQLTTISTTLNTIASAFTSVASSMTGPTTAPPPTLPTSVSSIIADATSLSALKVQVDLLKETLK